MAIIIGGDPRAERQEPVALAESKIDLDAKPVEVREASVEASEEPKAEVEARPVEEVKKPAKRVRRNGKKE